MKLENFIRAYGQPYSTLLGIDLASGENSEIVKWFLASILYSKPIREASATKTYRCFERYGVLTIDKILKTGWDGLVSILDEGSYTRYDFSTADRLLKIFQNLQRSYNGDLNHLHELSTDSRDLERRLKNLGKGIGDTTVSIFLRELREVWVKADPRPSQLVQLAMKELGIKDLKIFARERGVKIVNLETAILRLAKDFIKKRKTLQITL